MTNKNLIVAAIVALLVLAIAVFAIFWPRKPRDEDFSSFQFWTRDPAYGSPPLQNPWAPRSQLFRALEGSQVQPPYDDTVGALAHVHPLQVSAAMTARPDGYTAQPYAETLDDYVSFADDGAADEDFRGRRWWWRGPRSQYAAPLWYAGPLARYYWKYTPYYWPGQTPTYYGSYPYYATW